MLLRLLPAQPRSRPWDVRALRERDRLRRPLLPGGCAQRVHVDPGTERSNRGVVHTTEGTCCSYPQVAFCCDDSSPFAGDGFAICCTPDVDCPTACPTGSQGTVGARALAGPADAACCLNGTCGDLEACCAAADRGVDVEVRDACCFYAGFSCPADGEPPCCAECGPDDVCTCFGEGHSCDPSAFAGGCCAGLYCHPDELVCTRLG